MAIHNYLTNWWLICINSYNIIYMFLYDLLIYAPVMAMFRGGPSCIPFPKNQILVCLPTWRIHLTNLNLLNFSPSSEIPKRIDCYWNGLISSVKINRKTIIMTTLLDSFINYNGSILVSSQCIVSLTLSEEKELAVSIHELEAPLVLINSFSCWHKE